MVATVARAAAPLEHVAAPVERVAAARPLEAAATSTRTVVRGGTKVTITIDIESI